MKKPSLNTLIVRYEENEMNGARLFFTEETMKFFGDTLNNYYIENETKMVDGVECWELARRRRTKRNLISSSYFSCDTFEHLIE